MLAETGLVTGRITHQLGGEFARGVLAQNARLGREDGQVPYAVVQSKPAAQRLGESVGDLLQCDTGEVGARAGDPALADPGSPTVLETGWLTALAHPHQGIRLLASLSQPGTEVVRERTGLLAHRGELRLESGAARFMGRRLGGSMPTPTISAAGPPQQVRPAGTER